jgi:hypothetical protein
MTLKFEMRIFKEEISYYNHGKRHRNNGPASIYSIGSLSWFQYGKPPAYIYSDGSKSW